MSMHVGLLLLYDLHIGHQTFKGLCKIPRSGRLTFKFKKITSALPFLRTTELHFVISAYSYPQPHANNYVTFFTMSCVFSTIVPSYVRQGHQFGIHYYNVHYFVVILRVGFQEAIKILTACTKYQGINGFL